MKAGGHGGFTCCLCGRLGVHMTLLDSPGHWLGQKLMLDPVRSAVEIQVGEIVAGLPVLGGIVRRPLADSWVNAEVTLALDAGNIETGNPRWNERLRSFRAFDAANHPHIRFQGSILRRETSLQLELHGRLAFKTQVVPLVMDARCLGERAGAHRLLAQCTITAHQSAITCNARAGEGDDGGLERMGIVIHSEWIETSDPVPAA